MLNFVIGKHEDPVKSAEAAMDAYNAVEGTKSIRKIEAPLLEFYGDGDDLLGLYHTFIWFEVPEHVQPVKRYIGMPVGADPTKPETREVTLAPSLLQQQAFN